MRSGLASSGRLHAARSGRLRAVPAECVPKIIRRSAMPDGWLSQDPPRIAAARAASAAVVRLSARSASARLPGEAARSGRYLSGAAAASSRYMATASSVTGRACAGRPSVESQMPRLVSERTRSGRCQSGFLTRRLGPADGGVPQQQVQHLGKPLGDAEFAFDADQLLHGQLVPAEVLDPLLGDQRQALLPGDPLQRCTRPPRPPRPVRRASPELPRSPGSRPLPRPSHLRFSAPIGSEVSHGYFRQAFSLPAETPSQAHHLMAPALCPAAPRCRIRPFRIARVTPCQVSSPRPFIS
jgi:hypothetical protein